MPDFDRFEETTGVPQISVAAADLTGATGQYFGEQTLFEGVTLYDVDALLDRDELAVMMWAEHHLEVYATSTETADGTVRGVIEISASPDRITNATLAAGSSEDIADLEQSAFQPEVDHFNAPSADLIGRPLNATGFAPFSDGATGVGGAGTSGNDWWEGSPTAEPDFDARDELYLNGGIEVSNIDDSAIHVDVSYRHVYGVMEDFF